MSKGGFVAFRGSAAVAERYLAGRPGQDASAPAAYLAADRPFQHGVVTDHGVQTSHIDREQFRSWAEHIDPETGETRGSFRQRVTRSVGKDGKLVEKVGGTPLYQETLISASKSLSLAAAADDRIAEALEGAMARAAVRMAEAYREHAVTRVGPRGKQEQVKFDQIEFTSVQHHTSRTGDPHAHRHVQFLTTGLVTLPDGTQAWRAPDGSVLYRLAERLHAAADLAIATDVELREAIAEAGYTWVPGEGGGGVKEFETLSDEFSQRRDQVAARRESLEAQWRAEHPGREPSARQVQQWDHVGWQATRPDKHELAAEAQFDQDARLAAVVPTNTSRAVHSVGHDDVDARQIAEDALTSLAQQHSAWSRADLMAALDRQLALRPVMGDASALQAAALQAAEVELVSFYDDGVTLEGARHYTSRAVLATDAAITRSLRRRAQAGGVDGEVEVDRGGFSLSDGQAAAARAVAGTHQLVVIEGAAGTGKTTMLSAANEAIQAEGRRLVAVSPTKRGALEMASEIGAEGSSVHGLLVRAGARFDDQGRWSLPDLWRHQPDHLRMDARTTLVVDEVGMLDMNTAQALHQYCDDTGVQLVLMGDRRQLAAVGRGGYLAKAVHRATTAHDLRDVRRFRTADGASDEEYASASLALREREDAEGFFELLTERGQVRVGEPDEVIDRVAETVALELQADQSSIAITATNATAARINRAVYDSLAADGVLDTRVTATGRDGDPIAVGARVATRQNDADLQVANRQVWTVKRVNRDGRVIVADAETGHHATLEADYVREHLQLAYAVTAHGAQGMTVDTAHTLVSDQMNAAGTYVGLTRGRSANVLHAVGLDEDDARAQFVAAMGREGSDHGLDAARADACDRLQSLAPTPVEQHRRPVIEEAPPVSEPATPAPFRSRLRDLEASTPAAQQRLAGLAAVEERWHGAMPQTPEQRRQFEQQFAAVGVDRRLLDAPGVADAMSQDVRSRLEARAAQTEAGTATQERGRALVARLEELRERQRTTDRYGALGTKGQIAEVQARLSVEKEHLEALKADRASGEYVDREPERQRRLAESLPTTQRTSDERQRRLTQAVQMMRESPAQETSEASQEVHQMEM
ncbi:AAA family ATPase [Serinibacter salmoneus]|uniref:TrwC relaxase n=1 Tax=Serinibacter salmoneus TaxID=556530 RepID=A0A2A9D4D2_9MICO|nr:AAA family ATPase [Serinibacter salmoneus]PFG20709.1 TrwC relaxase [Serinibacter salmoneus]